MKKSLILIVSLAILVTLAFTRPSLNNSRTITINSAKSIEFDMVQNGDVFNKLKTPYTFKFDESKGNFIFKSRNEGVKLKLEVKNKYGSLSSNWETIVLVIDNQESSTFGIN